MAIGPVTAYREGVLRIARGELLFLTHTIKVALLKNTYTPNVDTHNAFADISASEITTPADYEAGHYTAGGLTLGTKTITELAGGNTMFDAADADFGDAQTISARYAVFYDDTTTPKYLLWYIDLNQGGSTPISSTASHFDILFPAGGIYQLQP